MSRCRYLQFLVAISFAVGFSQSVLAMYGPNIGRFTSRDPVSYQGSPYLLYEAFASSPLKFNDPTGTQVVGTGVKICDGYQKGSWLFGSSGLLHQFVTVDGQGIGYFEENLNSIGSGDVRWDDATTYPAKTPWSASNGEFYSRCSEITLNDSCWDVAKFKDNITTFAQKVESEKNDTYIAGYKDCFEFVSDAQGYAIRNAHKENAPCWCKLGYALEFDSPVPWWVTAYGGY